MPISPEQSRAARGLLSWSQTKLGDAANLSESTIRDFEKGRRIPSANNIFAIERAIHNAGVALLVDGEIAAGGMGVRWRTDRDGKTWDPGAFIEEIRKLKAG